jgi:hypothetical protein
MVVIVLTISVRGIAQNTSYWKKYHSADLALMTDLIIANQGDFSINYNMKELQKSFVTRTLRIDPLIFQTVLGDNAVFVYDESMDKDRFPQSYTFAADSDIKIIKTNLTSDYLVVYKEGDTVGIKDNSIAEAISCSSENTKGNLDEKRFEVMKISNTAETSSNPNGEDVAQTYSDYTGILLKTVGRGSNDEGLIVLSNSLSQPTTIYYTLHEIKSEKLSCLLRKQLLNNFPDMNIQLRPYDSSDKTLEVEPFFSQRSKYMYWIAVRINTKELTKEAFGNNLKSAIEEYYG